VRCIGHELALRVQRGGQRVEHDVECLGEPPELVAAAVVDAASQVARRCDALGRLRQPADRDQGRARNDEPQRSCERHASCGDHQQQEPDPAQGTVDLSERPRDLDRHALAHLGGIDPHVRAGDRLVAEERFACAGSDGSCATVDRETLGLARWAGDLACGSDELEVAGGAAELCRRDALGEPGEWHASWTRHERRAPFP
jgi:hypothetical protein